MSYTDIQLKQTLAKMLPDVGIVLPNKLYWKASNSTNSSGSVLDTELLHLCWLVEQGLNDSQYANYVSLCHIESSHASNNYGAMRNYLSATWQQRVVALARVKGIEIL